MPNYKLTYFNITGLGEPLRFLLSYGGVDFEDHRLGYDVWPQCKPTMPMGQVPILEIDDKVYHQSRAIGRYLAKKFQLYGTDEFETLEIDSAIDDIDDWKNFLTRFHLEQDETFKEYLKAITLERIPFYLGKFEEQVNKNDGYFVRGKLSWPDLCFTAFAELTNNVLNLYNEPNCLEPYPALVKLYEVVRAEPKIKAYLDKRPQTII